MAEAKDRARSAVDQGAGEAGLAQDVHRAANGVAFADRPEVKHHPRGGKPDRQGLRVQLHLAHANLGAGGREGGRVRQLPPAAHETPAADQGSDSDVEGAAALAVQPLRLRQ